MSATFEMSLWDYISKKASNLFLVRLAVVLIFIQFFLFKYFYPYAGYINGDSYVYLETAYHNFTVNTYPIGYSMFLRLFSVFTHSDMVVVLFQYLFLQVSALSLVFTVFYFFEPAKLTRIFLYVSMVINPVFLYLANYISSDAFFLSLSITWFTLLLWIMNRPNRKMIFVNAVVLFIAFTVRYNALFYPVISIAALLLTRRKIVLNLIGFALSLSLISVFVSITANKYKEVCGYRQFSPFTGWQIANNALYGYRYVDSADVKKVPPSLAELDNTVRRYFDTSRDVKTHPIETLVASTVYMWSSNSPLNIYMENQFKKDSTASPLKKWAAVAPVMSEYGSFLIRAYPEKFMQYYLIPNALKYYAPPVEFLATYSTGVDSVQQIAQVWFNYKSNKIKTRAKDFKVSVLDFYPVVTGTMNVIFLFSIFSFIALKGYKRYSLLTKGLVLIAVLWGVNFSFSVFASPIALRFQLFPILTSLIFAILLLEFLIKAAWGIGEKDVVNDHAVALNENQLSI